MSVIKKEHIFLPNKTLDYSKWAVIACDQFTSDKSYWEDVSNYVSDSPTSLSLVFPEIFLQKDNSEKIKEINKVMQEYYSKKLLCDEGPCMILLNRSTKQNKKRLGIVMAIDLEEYSFKKDEEKLIRATEGTIVERIPPRIEIRKDAIFEFPHIMLLYDDRNENIAENLYKNKDKLEKLYDFELNMGGGHLEGYKIKNVDEIIQKFDNLLKPEYLLQTFNTSTPLLFAVGDGNHSLATAKTHWENLKVNLTEEEQKNHPARFALVEVVNIHDSGIKFSPIYRVVYNANKKFIKGLKKLFKIKHTDQTKDEYLTQTIFYNGKEISFDLPSNTPLAIKMVQEYIDESLSKNLEMSVDYIHGLEDLKSICEKNKNAVGITLPTLDKKQLFEFIIKHGVLPRKAFSIGEAKEKRYYLEAHKIKLV